MSHPLGFHSEEMNTAKLKVESLGITNPVTFLRDWKSRLLILCISLLVTPVLQADFSAIPQPDAFMAEISKQPAFDAPLQKYYAAMVMQSLISSINLGANTGSTPYGTFNGPRVNYGSPEYQELTRLLRAYNAVATDLSAKVPPDQKPTQPVNHNGLHAYLVREHLPVFETYFPGSLKHFEASAGADPFDPRAAPPGATHATASTAAIEQAADRLSAARQSNAPPPPTPQKTMSADAKIAWNVFAAIFAGLGVLLVLRVIADRRYKLSSSAYSGVVTRENKRSEAEVKGSIQSNHQGYTTGSIGTTTTRFQEIFLRPKNGPEQQLEFVDFNVPCREGHHLAVVRLGRGGKYGWDCVYHNYDTDMSYYRTKLMEEVVLPKVGKLIPTLWMLAGACFSVPFAVSWNANPLGMIVAALAFAIGTLFIASLITNTILGNRAESRMPEVYQAIAREIESHRGSV